MKVCGYLFEKIEIDLNGDVYFCCQERIANHSLGNIFKSDFNEIWNSEYALKMRKAALKGEYPYCNKSLCNLFSNNEDENWYSIKEHYAKTMSTFPANISFAFNEKCNARCIFCRDEFRDTKEENIENIKNKIENLYIPLCKNAQYISLNTVGEVFASKLCQNFIKEISQKYPNIKYEILTNGIDATEDKIKELELSNKIKAIKISINAATAKTHKKIFRNNGYKPLVKNLKYLANLKKEGKIEELTFLFIVCKHNWKEMKQFIKFSKLHSANCIFWEVRDYNNDSLENKYIDLAVHLKTHKEFKKFKKYLLSDDFESENVKLFPAIQVIRNEALKEKEQKFCIKKLFYSQKR